MLQATLPALPRAAARSCRAHNRSPRGRVPSSRPPDQIRADLKCHAASSGAPSCATVRQSECAGYSRSSRAASTRQVAHAGNTRAGGRDRLHLQHKALAAPVQLRQIDDRSNQINVHPLPVFGQTFRKTRFGAPGRPRKSQCKTQGRHAQATKYFRKGSGKSRQQQNRRHQGQNPQPAQRRQVGLLFQRKHPDRRR